jgi:predicted RNA binding protein YcfA (HicA-like mRNA interferase family)
MPRLKTLSGPDVVRIFSEFEFMVASQRGSHIKLRRVLPDGIRQNLTIPNHRELDTGTLKAIYRQALRYIADEDLRPHFYSE